MTNKEFVQECKRSFDSLTEERQIKIIEDYMQKEMYRSEPESGIYFLKTPEANKPKVEQQEVDPEKQFKFYLWYHNNHRMPSWRITHFEIIAAITTPSLWGPGGLIREINNDPRHSGRERLWRLAEQWTNEFEKEYINYDWTEHGDYYDVLIEFCERENKKRDAWL